MCTNSFKREPFLTSSDLNAVIKQQLTPPPSLWLLGTSLAND